MALFLPHVKYAVLDLLEDSENEAPQINFKIADNPFLLSDAEFIKLFHLNKDATRYVCENVRHDLERERINTETALTIEDQVLTALLFYASGNSQRNIATNRYIKCKQGTVSKAIHDVSTAICINFSDRISFPNTPSEKSRMKEDFFKVAGFPGCVGAIDGTFVTIQAPQRNHPYFQEGDYFCQKNMHALNVMVVCDADMVIRSIDTTMPGSCNDSFVWKMSLLKLQEDDIFTESDWLIGDSGYPLEKHLINQFPNPSTPSEIAFNQSIGTTRKIVEQCIRMLKMRFCCLQRHKALHYYPDRAGNIVTACAILHNICLEYNIPLESDSNFKDDEMIGDLTQFVPNEADGDELCTHQLGQAVRAGIVEKYF